MISRRDQRSGHIWVTRLVLAVVVLAYLVLPALEARFILDSSANIPISDTWYFVPMMAGFTTTGHIPWGEIFSFYGAGRPVIERLGLLFDAKFFALNVQLVKLLTIVIGMLETLCAICAFRFALPRARLVVVLLAAYPVALVVFCWSNWQNILDEWNLMNLAAVALVFLAILLAEQLRSGAGKSTYLLVLAIVTCSVASFTGESGTLSWIACALVLWLPISRSRLREKLAFSVVGVVFLALYFAGSSPAGSGHPLHHLGEVVEFALICLGNGVISGGVKELVLARAIGIAEVVVVLVLLAVFYLDRTLHEDRAVHVGVGLIAFGCMGAVATGVSRLQIGIDTAMSSRYVALTAPVAIGIYLIVVRLAAVRESEERRVSFGLRRAGLFALPCLLAAAFCVTTIGFDVKESKVSTSKKAYYVALQHMTCDPAAYSDADLSKFDHSGGLDAREKAVLLDQIADLRRAKLNVFSDSLCEEYARAAARGPRHESSRSAVGDTRVSIRGRRPPTAL